MGRRIKGARSVLEDIGSFDLSSADGKVKLWLLFVALHGTFSDDPEARSIYRRLGAVARDREIELQFPELVSP